MRRRDWCKLDEDWAGNKKVRKVLRKHGPVAGAYWALLVAKSYADSHHVDNPAGVINCSLQDLADKLSDRQDRREMWQAMIDAKLIKIKGGDWKSDVEADVRVEVINFAKWQWPKGSPAARQAKNRGQKKDDDLQGSVTVPSQVVTTCHEVSQSVTQIESESKREMEKKTSSSTVEESSEPPRSSVWFKKRPHDDEQNTSQLEAETEAVAVEKMTEVLASISSTQSEAAAVAEQMLFSSRKKNLSIEHYIASCEQCVAKVKSGWKPEGSLVGYIIACAPSALATLTIDPSVAAAAPLDWSMMSDEERAVAFAAKYGGPVEVPGVAS